MVVQIEEPAETLIKLGLVGVGYDGPALAVTYVAAVEVAEPEEWAVERVVDHRPGQFLVRWQPTATNRWADTWEWAADLGVGTANINAQVQEYITNMVDLVATVADPEVEVEEVEEAEEEGMQLRLRLVFNGAEFAVRGGLRTRIKVMKHQPQGDVAAVRVGPAEEALPQHLGGQPWTGKGLDAFMTAEELFHEDSGNYLLMCWLDIETNGGVQYPATGAKPLELPEFGLVVELLRRVELPGGTFTVRRSHQRLALNERAKVSWMSKHVTKVHKIGWLDVQGAIDQPALVAKIQHALLQARAEACVIAHHGALPPLSPPISVTTAHAELQREVVAPPVVLGTHNGDTCDVPQLYEVCLALCLSTCPPTQPRAQVFTQHGVDFGAFLDAAGVVGTVDTLTCLNSLNWDVVQCAPPHSLCVSLATASLLALSEWQVAVHEGGWHSAGRTEAQQLLARASVGGAAG